MRVCGLKFANARFSTCPTSRIGSILSGQAGSRLLSTAARRTIANHFKNMKIKSSPFLFAALAALVLATGCTDYRRKPYAYTRKHHFRAQHPAVAAGVVLPPVENAPANPLPPAGGAPASGLAPAPSIPTIPSIPDAAAPAIPGLTPAAPDGAAPMVPAAPATPDAPPPAPVTPPPPQ